FGATSFSWSGGVANATSSIPTISGVYTVVGTDANGCQNSGIASITVNALPVLSIAGALSICPQSIANLTATGANNFTWYPGLETSSIVNLSPSATTNYTLIGVNTIGNCESAKEFIVDVQPFVRMLDVAEVGNYGLDYNQSLSSVLGLSFNLVAGVLPQGLTLDVGSISGTATQSGNYLFTISGNNGTCSSSKSYSIEIQKANLLATIEDFSLFQFGTLPTTFNGTSFVGIVRNDNFSVNYSTDAVDGNTNGIFDINGTISGTNLANYNITVIPGKLTIIAPFTLTAKVTNVIKEYGNPDPVFEGTVTGIDNAFPNVTVSYYTNTNSVSGFGLYPILATLTGTDAFRYSLVSNTVGGMTIRTRRLIVRTNDFTIAQGQPIPTDFPTTITGLLSGSLPKIIFSTELIPGETNKYNIIPEIEGIDLNLYSLVLFPGILTERPAVTIIGDSFTKTYGEINPIFTGTVLGLLQNAPYVFVSYVSQANQLSTIGGYTITPIITGSDAAKYGFVTVAGILEISKANLTIKPANLSRDDDDTNPFNFAPVITGLVNNDQINVSFITDAPNTSTIGNNYIIYPVSINGRNLENYNLTTAAGVLRILSTVPDLIPLTISAGNFTRKYGEIEGSYGGSTEGIIEATDNIIITYMANTNIESNIGTYTLTPHISGDDMYKYSFTTVAGLLNIVPNTLTVTSLNYTREYGDPNPIFFNTQIEGLLNGDKLIVSSKVTQTQTSDAGIYPILPAINSTVSPNYNVVTVAGKLTITKAILTVIGGSFTRMYNQPNPILGYNLEGYKGDDQIGMIDNLPIGETLADLLTPVSLVPSTVNYSGASDNNYDFVYQTGEINIVKSTQTITGFRNFAKIGINNPITISGFASSGLPLDILNSTPSVATLNGQEINGVSDGVTTITINQTGDDNYLAANTVEIIIMATSTGIVSVSVLGIMGPEVVFQGVPATYIMPSKPGYTYDWGYIPLSTTGRNITWLNPSDTLKNSVSIVFAGNSPAGSIVCKMYDEFGNLVKSDKLDLFLSANEEAAAIAELAQTLAPLDCPPVITDCKTNFISVFNYGKKVSSKTSCSKGGFGDFTASGKIDTLIMGNAYNFTMGATTGENSSSLIYFAIWLDYNNNGSYEDLDDFLRASSEPSNTLELKNLVIRNNDKYEGPRRIRISMKTTVITQDQSCTQEGIVGETEDYMVYIKKPQALEAPSLITPNEDGKNDYFVIKGINPKFKNKLTLMDRWGVVKYEVENYQNEFNGIIDGVVLQDGTYFYFFNHGDVLLKGFVEIKRK
ncbi:MAG: gliding motility-associated C-terminal domain-containing protein, partial [Cytophagales bacterium]